MRKKINTYENKIDEVLNKVQSNPINPSSVFSLNRMAEGLAVTGLQSRLSEIDGNPELGKRISSVISKLDTDSNTLNPSTDSIENKLNNIFNISPINTRPPLNVIDLQDESSTSKKFDVQNDYRPIEDIKPSDKISSVLKSDKKQELKIPKVNLETTKNKDGGSVGKTGTILQAIAPTIFSTIDAFLTKKNQNNFADFGREGLNTLQESKRNINVDVQDRLNNIISESNTTKRNIDKNTTSLNVGRALKSGVDATQLKAETDVTVAGIDKQTQLDSIIAQQQNQRDQVVMQGNDLKTERDAQDLSSIVSNFSASAISAGKGMEHLQKINNSDSYNSDVLNIINSMFGSTNLERDTDGKLVIKKRIG